MTAAAPAATVETPKRRFRVKRLLVGALIIVVIGAAANLLGWDLRGWFSDLWDTISEISIGYLIAAVTLKTVQTSLTAFGWYSILRFAYGDAVRWRDIWACYAASVALNGVLPANIGTLVMLLMFTAIIAGATFAAILGGYAVQKIFFTVIGIFIYLYLLARRIWPRVVAWWEDAKEGGAILGHPRKYFVRVFLPSFLAWVASLGVM